MTVTDKELSQSKHMSVPGSLLPFRQNNLDFPHPAPAPGFAVHRGTTNKQAQAGGGGVCPALSLHNGDVSLSRPAEAQELIHREGESAHFKEKKKGKREKIRRVTVSTSVRRGDGGRLCAKTTQLEWGRCLFAAVAAEESRLVEPNL